MVKEGKRDPNAPYVEKKRSVKRDLFEPSSENPVIKTLNNNAPPKEEYSKL